MVPGNVDFLEDDPPQNPNGFTVSLKLNFIQLFILLLQVEKLNYLKDTPLQSCLLSNEKQLGVFKVKPSSDN